MNEYFVQSYSNPAPFFGDADTSYLLGFSAEDAMKSFRISYKHPCGLNKARLWNSADDYHKGKEPLVSWEK